MDYPAHTEGLEVEFVLDRCLLIHLVVEMTGLPSGDFFEAFDSAWPSMRPETVVELRCW